MDATTETAASSALDTHVHEYLAELGPGAPAILLTDAIEHGWHGARADLAETLRDLVTEARAEVAKRMPFPILSRLDALVTELENGLGQ